MFLIKNIETTKSTQFLISFNAQSLLVVKIDLSIQAVLWNFVGACAIFVWTTFLCALCFWLCSKLRNHQFFISKEKFNKNEVYNKKENEIHSDEGLF